jgi:hypothetical protein
MGSPKPRPKGRKVLAAVPASPNVAVGSVVNAGDFVKPPVPVASPLRAQAPTAVQVRNTQSLAPDSDAPKHSACATGKRKLV